jgi:hypothetical protein
MAETWTKQWILSPCGYQRCLVYGPTYSVEHVRGIEDHYWLEDGVWYHCDSVYPDIRTLSAQFVPDFSKWTECPSKPAFTAE